MSERLQTSEQTLAGQTIAVTVQDGPRPSVLMLHCSGMSGAVWRPLMAELAGQRRSIAPDLVGYGRNPPWPDDTPFDAELDVGLCAELLQAEALSGPVDIVGHSYGGWIAMQLALRYPDKVRRLVLHEPVAWGVLYSAGAAEDVAAFEAIDADGRFFDDAFGGSDGWLERFVDFWSGPGVWAAMPQPRKDAQRAVGRKLFMEVRGLCHDRLSHSKLAELRLPVRITVGEHTIGLQKRVVELLAASIIDARVQAIPGGHMAPITHPQTTSRHVHAYLTEPLHDGPNGGA